MLHTFGFNFFGGFFYLQIIRILHRLCAVKRRARIAAENIGRYIIPAVHRVVILRHLDYLFSLFFWLIRFAHRLSAIFFPRLCGYIPPTFEVKS